MVTESPPSQVSYISAERIPNRGGFRLTAYDPARYGESVGDDYDVLYPGDKTETEAAVRLLSDLAASHADASVLEFGIGTGRLALALHNLGLRVAGIEGSERMVAGLKRKSGGDAIDVVVGDYRDASVAGTYSLVALVFNGIFDPRGRQAQLDIFRNAAHHLSAGGYFVVESWVMNDAQRDGGWSIVPRYVGNNHVELQLARYDIHTNQIQRTLVHLRPEGLDFLSVSDTYASPGELDVMADVTGFDRVARYGGWSRTEFTSRSRTSISVYRLRDESGTQS